MHEFERVSTAPKASRMGRCGNRFRRTTVAMTALAAFALAAARADTALPQIDGDVHFGVATCASSTCHGAAAPRDASHVLQNEYLTWHRLDRHARAYELLLEERSQRIARRLGLGRAERADACLDCHADNVPPEDRGEQFQISDGVGCEACHGGAEKWIRSHADERTSHADNLADGLYPTEDPRARTRLCMSCHFSHPETPMTHRLMGAGHPPLLFDLDIFTHLQPPHYRRDADYRRRKGAVSAADAWAIGEATGAGIVLETLAAGLDGEGGLFPELYYFECSACHHELGGDWPLRATGMPAGSVRLEDAMLRMLGYVMAEVDPALARSWSQRLTALHDATLQDKGATRAAAERLRRLAEQARERLQTRPLDATSGRGIMRRIASAGVRSGFAFHGWAEQSAMALASLLTTAAEERWFDGARQQRLESALDRLYRALDDERGYSPWRYRDALRQFNAALG